MRGTPLRRGILALDIEGFGQPVRVHAKETRTRAWVHPDGLARQPTLPAVLAAPPVGPASLPIPRDSRAD